VAVRSGAPAPYGPPQGALAMIHGFRDRGLTVPFTAAVYAKAGISESLIPRVKNTMEGLDLVDAEGNPTQLLLGLRAAKTDEFQARLAEVVRAAYSEVFQFVDPMKDDLNRITDAFRDYIPHGQRTRMVTLFMGLCEAAGLAPPSTGKPAASNGRPSAPAKKRPEAQRKVPPAITSHGGGSTLGGNGIPPALLGVLSGLPSPEQGWTREQREHFYTAFGALLDFSIPIREAAPRSAAVADADDAE
jgi:hypothetical protein